MLAKVNSGKLITIILSLLVTFSILAYGSGAATFAHSCSSSDSQTFTDSGGTYYLQVSYDYGTSFPYDDARCTATAGAATYKAREVYAYLVNGSATTGVQRHSSFSAIGSGIQNISIAAELSGYDHATGYAYAATYNGYTFQNGYDPTYGQTINKDSRLNIY
ncbi:hypothetical protein [Ruminiclostridium josui]|uniref:hypothetical protein n=1 Tax=Ruminiclostridium josui TaxID=1499 RepID=UPI000466194B|nr:hypothetical protein [Ruminiclostridium josui]